MAADLTVTGLFGQRFEAVSRTGDNEDSGLRSITDLGLAALVSTPTTEWRLAPGLRGTLSTLEDDSDADILPRFNGSVVHRTPRNRYNGTVSVVPDFTDETRFEEGGRRTETNALQITGSARLGFDHSIDARNTLSSGVFFRTRTYVDDAEDLDDTRSYGLDGTWRRGLQADTSATLRAALRRFESDAPSGTDGTTLSLTPGFQHSLTRSVSISGALGPSVTWSDANEVRGTGERTDFGLVGDLSGTLIGPDYRLTLGLVQDIDQDNDGELQNRTTLRGNGTYRINDVSQLSLGVSLGFQTYLEGDREDRAFFSLTPSYSYDVTRDWSVGVGYRLRVTNDDDFGTNNTVFLRLSRGLDFLP